MAHANNEVQGVEHYQPPAGALFTVSNRKHKNWADNKHVFREVQESEQVSVGLDCGKKLVDVWSEQECLFDV